MLFSINILIKLLSNMNTHILHLVLNKLNIKVFSLFNKGFLTNSLNKIISVI